VCRSIRNESIWLHLWLPAVCSEPPQFILSYFHIHQPFSWRVKINTFCLSQMWPTLASTFSNFPLKSSWLLSFYEPDAVFIISLVKMKAQLLQAATAYYCTWFLNTATISHCVYRLFSTITCISTGYKVFQLLSHVVSISECKLHCRLSLKDRNRGMPTISR
jgi:hypothetical protein